MAYSYCLTKIPIEPKTPILIGSQGGLMTDVFTPKAYLNLKIEREMKRLDDLMFNYVERYLRAREALLSQRQETLKKYEGVNPFELIHSFTPEEQLDYQGLVAESLKTLRRAQ